jgi:hypothetical protein
VWSVGDLAGKFTEWYGVNFDQWFYDKAIENLVAKGFLAKANGGYRASK